MAQVNLTILGEDRSSPVVSSWENKVKSAVNGVKTALTALGVTAAGLSIAAAFKKGIEAVDEFQQSVIKTSAIITSLQGGNNIAENYRLAKEYADALQDALMQVDAQTSLNLTNLNQITEEMVKQGVVLDINNKQQIEGFTALANAVAVYSQNGAQEVQVRQEVRALMMGEVDANSQLASMIQKTVDGPLKDKVKQWKESGVLVEELGKRLVGFNAASGDISNTWSAISSTFETIVTRILRGGFGDVVKDIVEFGQQLGDQLKENEDLIGNRIKQGWLAVKGLAEGVYNIFVNQKGELTIIGTLVSSIVKGWGLLLYSVFPPLMQRVGSFMRAMWESTKMLGNIVMMAVEASKFNFSGAAAYWDAAKVNWMENGKAVAEAFAAGFGDEVATRANQFLALDNVVKSTKGKVATPSITPAPNLDELTKQYKARAKEIIQIEKERIKALEDLEQEHLKKLKSTYEQQVTELDKFADAMREIYQSWEDRDKARIDAARGVEDPLVRQARLVAELAEAERKLTESWADPAAKVKGLNDLIPKYRELFGEIKYGEDVIVSQAEADRDFTIAEERIKSVIKGVISEMDKKADAAVKTATAMNEAEERLKSYKQQLSDLDSILRTMQSQKVIDVTVKINGIQDLYRMQSLMGNNPASGIVSYGDFYTQGGSTYWNDGTLADSGTGFVLDSYATGTPYVPKTGPYLLHEGERVVPKNQNQAGMGNVTIGDINVNLPPGTPQQNARETARAIYAELQKLGMRTRTA